MELSSAFLTFPTNLPWRAIVLWSIVKVIIYINEASFLIWWLKLDLHFRSARPFVSFLVASFVFHCIIGLGFIGTLFVFAEFEMSGFAKFLQTWVFGDLAGVISVTVLFLVLTPDVALLVQRLREAEMPPLAKCFCRCGAKLLYLLSDLALLVVCLVVWMLVTPRPNYVCFFPIVFSVLRHGMLAICVFFIINTFVMVAMAMEGTGNVSVLELQLFLLTTGICAMLIGITQRQSERYHTAFSFRSQQLLEEQKRVNRLQQRLLANVSHEIRTPLYGILGMLEICCGEGVSPSAIRENMTCAYDAGKVLLYLLNDIIDYRKLVEGKLKIALGPFNPLSVARSCIALFRAQFVQKGLTITLESNEGTLPSVITGDEVRLAQILSNLVMNALKFTEKGGVVIKVAYNFANSELSYTVTDTGIGIAADRIDTIFEKFVQVDDSPTRQFHGAGLGLSIVKELLTLMGGTVTATSTKGVGSVFTVRVPCAETSPSRRSSSIFSPVTSPSTQAASQRLPDTGPMIGVSGASQSLALESVSPPPLLPTSLDPGCDQSVFATTHRPLPVTSNNGGDADLPLVLVVEDNDLVRRITTQLLTGSFRFHTAENGQIALDLVSKDISGYSAILMDMQMPIMDGLEATAQIRKLLRENPSLNQTSLPIIGLTASCFEEDVARCLSSGMDVVLNKPTNRKTLLRTLNQFIGSSNKRSVASSAQDGGGRGEESPRVSAEGVALEVQTSSLSPRSNGSPTSGPELPTPGRVTCYPIIPSPSLGFLPSSSSRNAVRRKSSFPKLPPSAASEDPEPVLSVVPNTTLFSASNTQSFSASLSRMGSIPRMNPELAMSNSAVTITPSHHRGSAATVTSTRTPRSIPQPSPPPPPQPQIQQTVDSHCIFETHSLTKTDSGAFLAEDGGEEAQHVDGNEGASGKLQSALTLNPPTLPSQHQSWYEPQGSPSRSALLPGSSSSSSSCSSCPSAPTLAEIIVVHSPRQASV